MARPMIYESLYTRLDLQKLYSPTLMVDEAVEAGLFDLIPNEEGFDLQTRKSKARIAVCNFGRRNLPQEPDGMVSTPGRRDLPGWWGARWVLAIQNIDEDLKERAQQTLALLERPSTEEEAVEAPQFTVVGKTEQKTGQSLTVEEVPPVAAAVAAANESPDEDLDEGDAIEGRRMIPEYDQASPGLFLKVLLHVAMMSKLKRLALTFGLVSAFALGAVVTFSDQEGFRILREQGPGQALTWFLSSSEKHLNNQDARFGIAWASFLRGDLSDAQKMAYELMGLRDLKPEIKPKLFYLLGHIEGKQGRHDSSRVYFQEAISLYEEAGELDKIFNAYLGLARSLMENGEFDEAEGILELAIGMNQEQEKGYFYYLHSRLAFLRGDYRTALEQSYRSHAEYLKSGDRYRQADALVEIAFYRIITGDLNGGFEKTMAAQEQISMLGDQDLYFYNSINMIILRRCEGGAYQSLVDSVKNRIRREHDSHLYEELAFALTFECNTDRGGEGIPPDPSSGKKLPVPEDGGEGIPPDPNNPLKKESR